MQSVLLLLFILMYNFFPQNIQKYARTHTRTRIYTYAEIHTQKHEHVTRAQSVAVAKLM